MSNREPDASRSRSREEPLVERNSRDYDRIHYVELSRKIAKAHKVDVTQVLGKSRIPEFVRVRHEVWVLLRGQNPPWSHARIGRAARVDHTTVLAAVAKKTKEA